jgi:hypothetical protein
MTSKLVLLLLSRVSGFSLVLYGIGFVFVGGVMIGTLVGLTLKDMGYPVHITLLFPILPIIIGGGMALIGFHYDGIEESTLHKNQEVKGN